MPWGPKKMPKMPSNEPLIFERKGVISVVPSGTPSGPTPSAAVLLDPRHERVLGRLAPRIVRERDEPLLAQLVNQVRRRRHRLGRRVVDGQEDVAAARRLTYC